MNRRKMMYAYVSERMKITRAYTLSIDVVNILKNKPNKTQFVERAVRNNEKTVLGMSRLYFGTNYRPHHDIFLRNRCASRITSP